MPKKSASESKSDSQLVSTELLADPKDAVKPVAIQNGRIIATYLGLGLERDKGKKLIHLDFSFALEDRGALKDLVPKKVLEAWKFLDDTDNKLIEVRGLDPVTLDVYVDPKKVRPALHLAGAQFSKAVVAVREEVGKGATREVVRFSFRLLVERSEEIVAFAAWHDDEEFWLTMPSTQQSLAKGA